LLGCEDGFVQRILGSGKPIVIRWWWWLEVGGCGVCEREEFFLHEIEVGGVIWVFFFCNVFAF